MTRIVPSAAALCLLAFVTFSLTLHATTIIGGNIINQTWMPSGNPYIIQGDIVIPSGSTLTIQPGTLVQFASTDGQAAGTDPSRVEVIVNGTLSAIGNATNRITFAAQTGSSNSIWYGFEINSAAIVTIANADFRNAVTAFSSSATNTSLQLSNCTFALNNTGVTILTGSPTISRVQCYSNTTYGAAVNYAGTPTFVQSLFYANSYGAVVSDTQSGYSATFLNCVIHGNTYYGLYTTGTNRAIVRNCIVTQNGSAGLFASTYNNITATYNDVWGNLNNYNNCTAGAGSISTDPFYTATNNPPNFRLRTGSPCIDSGDNTVFPPGITTDLDDNPRFHDDPQSADIGNGTAPIIDIGPYENQSNQSVPTLQINQSAPSTLTLLWPTNAVGFTLQSNATTFSSASWFTVPASPTITGTNNSIILPSVSQNTLFRLKK